MFMVEKALVGSRRYWAWVGTLFAVILVGVLFYLHQLQVGLGITGLNRDVMWGLYIAQFTFLVGVAASAVMVVLPYYLHDWKAFGKITILGEFLAISAVTMCALFIFVDMGQPMRALNVLLYPTPSSMMFWDMVSLSGYLLLNALIALITLTAERQGVAPPGWIRPVIIISIPWAISIHTVTAFLLVGNVARPFWNSAVLAARFIASAFTGGMAFMAIVFQMIRSRTSFTIGDATLGIIRRIIQVTLLINMFLLVAELFKEFYSEQGHFTSAHYLFFGLKGHTGLVPWIWTAVGLNSAATLLLVLRVSRKLWIFNVACVFLLLGIWIEKGMGLIIPGFIPTPLGEVVDYSPTLEESLVTVGIWAIGFMVYTLLLKVAVPILKGTLAAPQTDLAPTVNRIKRT